MLTGIPRHARTRVSREGIPMTALPFSFDGNSDGASAMIGVHNCATSIDGKTGEVECTILEVGAVDADGKAIVRKPDGLPHTLMARVDANPGEPIRWGLMPFGGFEALAENGGPVLECTKQVEDLSEHDESAREMVDYLSALVRTFAEASVEHAVTEWASDQTTDVPDDIRALLALGDDANGES